MNAIKIDIVSDVACPWCYIGKRRIEEAIKQWQGTTIEVNWLPFQLDPTIPATGVDRKTYLQNKFGDIEKVNQILAPLVQAGQEEGISFNFGDKWLAVNTLPLHQLLYVAGKEGFKNALKESFFHAYFVENLHLNDTKVLCEVLKEFSWDDSKTRSVIEDTGLAKEVQQQIASSQARGVTGVPFFIINDKYGISGAQPSSAFLEAFAQVEGEVAS